MLFLCELSCYIFEILIRVMMMRLRIAETYSDMLSVWRFTHDVYVETGYAERHSNGLLRHYPHLDCIPETTVFIIEDDDNRIIGTNTVTIDGPFGLHVEDEFKSYVDSIRKEIYHENKILACSWRIVTAANHRSKIDILISLIGVTIYFCYLKRIDTVLFNFTLKHAKIYSKLIGLNIISEPKSHKSVNGTYGVLVRGDTDTVFNIWKNSNKKGQILREHISTIEEFCKEHRYPNLFYFDKINKASKLRNKVTL